MTKPSKNIKGPRAKKSSEITDPESQYKKTGDFRFVALVIGRYPNNIPKWALDACTKLYKSWEIGLSTFSDTRKWTAPIVHPDGPLLDQMADYLIRHVKAKKSLPTINAAATFVAKDNCKKTLQSIPAEIKRLTNAWNAEAKSRPVDIGDPSEYSAYPLHGHVRFQQAAVRYVKEKFPKNVAI